MKELVAMNVKKCSSESTMNKRNYGIDLLRIVSMFLVVISHVIGQGGILGNLQLFSAKGIVTEFLFVISLACVNIYALISGYVGVTAKHKYSNLIQLWFQVLFYSIIITIVYVTYTYVNTGVLEIKTLIKGFMPFTFDQYWYFSAYVILFLFMPLLNYILLNVPRKELKLYGCFAFVAYCVFGLVANRYNSVGSGYSFLWLAILYLVGGYISIYNPFKNISNKKSIIFSLIIVLFTVITNLFVNYIFGETLNLQYSFPYLFYYNAPNIIAIAILFLVIFSKLRIKQIWHKIISIGASTSFGVYLIHVHPLIYFNLIDHGFANLAKGNLIKMIGLIIIVCIGIYLVSSIIDLLRIGIFKLFNVKKLAICIEKKLRIICKKIISLRNN